MKTKKIISWIFLLGWMLIIFFFSAQTASESSGLSSGLAMKLETLTHIPFSNNILQFSLRKMAHFSEYTILGILVARLVALYQNIELKKENAIKLLLCILFCFFYAATDEFHQLFVIGRSGQFLDVLIDTCGGSFGIMIYLFMISWRNLWKIKK